MHTDFSVLREKAALETQAMYIRGEGVDGDPLSERPTM